MNVCYLFIKLTNCNIFIIIELNTNYDQGSAA